MEIFDAVPLTAIGWDESRRAQYEALTLAHPTETSPGRIVRIDRGVVTVQVEGGTVRAEISPRVYREGNALAVGDWVAVQSQPDGGVSLHVVAVLPRTGVFARRAPADRAGGEAPQVLAANVDVAFLVAAATDVRAGRLERAGVVTWEAGARPLVVLTKADLLTDPSAAYAAAEEALPGVPVHLVDALGGDGVQALTAYLGSTTTVVLLGASGVGKSTLANALLGTDALETGAVREADGRGRHTTTARHLLPLPGGGALIDTPGIRSIATWGADAGIDMAFPEIEELAATCRFTDCAHRSEPGCTVRAALEAGTLDAARFERFQRLERERAFEERKADPALQAAERRKWKHINHAMRRRKRD
ncbi:MAG: ribosome small subunit-dependent GTPase A, partial [Chloroflexi bacterium]|nr:ribosome small subunit-dependent GTPase A [Chloroflexota bacterium]MQC25544.1 ribosome small subunit-dependent GTPase A [Chloroflexota bacterium]